MDHTALPLDSLSFNIGIWINDPIVNTFVPNIYQKSGSQNGSYLKIKDVQAFPGLEADIYNVTFQIKCNLYWYDVYDIPFLWRTLDAEARLTIALPHK